MTVAQRGSDETEPRGWPSLVRPRRSRIEQRVAASSLLAHRMGKVRLDVLDWEFRISGFDSQRLEQPKIDVHDVSRLARIVNPTAAGIVGVGIEGPGQRLPQIRGRESN